MQKPIDFVRSSTILVLTLATFAIALKYPGLINIKFPGSEILIDGRSIQTPTVGNKLLNQK